MTPTFDSISKDELNAISWINSNIPDGKKFIILTQSPNWQLDHFNEWFPALTQQTSATTVQGSEWLSDGGHNHRIWFYNGIKSCVYDNSSCLLSTINTIGMKVDYIVINHDICDAEKIVCLITYSEAMNSKNSYTSIYESRDVTIYKIQTN